MDLTTATPREIDTRLAEIYTAIHGAIGARDANEGLFHSVLGDKGRYVTRTRKVYSTTLADAIVQVRDLLASTDAPMFGSYYRRSVVRALEIVDAATAEISRLQDEAAPLEQAYAEAPWSRFFVVTGGHIHRAILGATVTCGSVRWNTLGGLVPELSGKSDAEAIEYFGGKEGAFDLCSKCFKDAPVLRLGLGAQVDDGTCEGSGTFDYPRETARLGYHSGNYGVCSHCGQKVTVSSLGKMRKHKKA